MLQLQSLKSEMEDQQLLFPYVPYSSTKYRGPWNEVVVRAVCSSHTSWCTCMYYVQAWFIYGPFFTTPKYIIYSYKGLFTLEFISLFYWCLFIVLMVAIYFAFYILKCYRWKGGSLCHINTTPFFIGGCVYITWWDRRGRGF